MLVGQEISFSSSLFISLIGILVVLLELGLLAIFVKILSKVMEPFSKKAPEKQAKPAPKAASAPAAAKAAPAPASAKAVSSSPIDADELAAVMAAVCEENGLSPEEMRFISIEQQH